MRADLEKQKKKKKKKEERTVSPTPTRAPLCSFMGGGNPLAGSNLKEWNNSHD